MESKLKELVISTFKLARDLASFQAGRANILTLCLTIDDRANLLNIWIPTATGSTL